MYLIFSSNLIVKCILILIFFWGLISCKENGSCGKVDILNVIKETEKIELSIFSQIRIFPRSRNGCSFYVENFDREFNGVFYRVPNFDNYDFDAIDSIKHLNVNEYLNVRNISKDSLRIENSKILDIYRTLGVIEIWGVDNAIILNLDNKKYLMYCEDTTLIINKYWKNFVEKSISKNNNLYWN